MKILVNWTILTLAILLTAYVVPGIHVSSGLAAIMSGAMLTFINFIIKPIINILTLPINIVTLGLFSFILNGIFFYFVAKIIFGFSVDNFHSALLGALIVSILSWIGNKILVPKD